MAAIILRNASRNGILRAAQSPFLPAASRAVSLRPVTPPVENKLGHDLRNMKLNRPMSPHLTIYQYQLTAALSITHRMTGVALAGYAIVLGGAALVLPHDATTYINMIEGLGISAPILYGTKAILAYPFTYHATNGVRHLLWDLGKFLSIKEVYATGYTMVAIAVALAGGIAML